MKRQAPLCVIGTGNDEIAQATSMIFLFNGIAAINGSSPMTVASIWGIMHNTGGTVLECAAAVKLPPDTGHHSHHSGAVPTSKQK